MVLCTMCKKCIHNKCCGMKGALKDNFGFICPKCAGVWVENKMMKKEIALGQDEKFEIVERFCYLGDTISEKSIEKTYRANIKSLRTECLDIW